MRHAFDRPPPQPALRCERPRDAALQRDEAAIAAGRTDSQRVSLIDLSSFMCDRDYCFPVIGGALVIKDIGHLTRTFATTLGPYLDRDHAAPSDKPARAALGLD
jgi:hypothetical protein